MIQQIPSIVIGFTIVQGLRRVLIATIVIIAKLSITVVIAMIVRMWLNVLTARIALIAKFAQIVNIVVNVEVVKT
jgi:hypothetical protein